MDLQEENESLSTNKEEAIQKLTVKIDDLSKQLKAEKNDVAFNQQKYDLTLSEKDRQIKSKNTKLLDSQNVNIILDNQVNEILNDFVKIKGQ